MSARHAIWRIAEHLVAVLAIPLLSLAAMRRGRRDLLLWMGTPIVNLKYWSAAMNAAGRASQTVVSSVYTTINRRDDFDLVYDDLVPRWVRRSGIRRIFAPYAALLHALRRASVVHVSFDGGPLGITPLWRREAGILRRAGIPVVVVPYGGDVFVYSRVADPSVRDGLLRSYPEAGRNESKVAARVDYWSQEAAAIVVGFTLDGIPRWDAAPGNMVALDTREWSTRPAWGQADGGASAVRILHAPNHRGAKGTPFVLQAVDQLRAEGLSVELVLVERMQNAEVRRLMLEADILADQLVLPGYGLAAIEGMASGLPVLCNLDHPGPVLLFDRTSYLRECPVVSATPESVAAVLRRLVRSPALREELGRAGRAYVEKYHSYAAAQYLFGAVQEHVLGRGETDISMLFDPLSSPYNNGSPPVAHPLIDHRLPPTGAGVLS